MNPKRAKELFQNLSEEQKKHFKQINKTMNVIESNDKYNFTKKIKYEYIDGE